MSFVTRSGSPSTGRAAWRVALALLVLVVVSSCSDSRGPSAARGALGARWPSLATELAASATAVARDAAGEGFQVLRSPLGARLPRTTGAAMELDIPGTAAVVRVQRRGASSAAGVIDGGLLVYPGRAIDTVVLGTHEGVEELLVAREREALAYDVALPASFTMRQVTERTLEILDAAGTARLRVSTPRGWDGDGNAMPLALHADARGFDVEVPPDAVLPWLVDPVWTSTKTMMSARTLHTATLLASGKILVTGGYDGAANQPTTELFSPATGTFTSSGSLHVARSHHVATLLRDGQVLVTGGLPPITSAPVADAELYDPASGTFTAIAPMKFGRADHTATLLNDGRVLIVGGSFQSAAAEIYDPVAKTFTPSGAMMGLRRRHTATRLPSGDVAVIGGESDEAATLSLPPAEVFDVGSGKFGGPTGGLAPRVGHTATLMPAGTVLLSGGQGLKTELYDPVTGSVSGTSAVERVDGAAVLLPSDVVLLVGGSTSSSNLEAIDATLFSEVPGTLQDNRLHATATLLPSGDVIILGGNLIDGNGIVGRALSSVEIFAPDTGALKQGVASLSKRANVVRLTQLLDGTVLASGGSMAPSNGLDVFDPVGAALTIHATMVSSRAYHTATLLTSGAVLIAGGEDDNGVTLSSAEIYALGASKVIAKMRVPRKSHAAVRLTSGKILLVGGDGADVAELYDPATTTFRPTGTLTVPRVTPLAVLLPDGKVLVAGGTDASAQALASAELYDPSTEKFTATGSMQAARTSPAAALLASGQVLVAGGNSTSAEIFDPTMGKFVPTAGPMNVARVGLTATLLPSGKVAVLGGGFGPTANANDELYDPRLGEFLPSSSRLSLRGHAAALLPTGGVLVAGGLAQVSVGGTIALSLFTPPPIGQDAARWPFVRAAPRLVAGGAAIPLSSGSFTTAFEANGGTASSSANDAPIAVWMPVGGGLIEGGLSSWTTSGGLWTTPLTSLTGPGMLFVGLDGVFGPATMMTLGPGVRGAPCAHDAECADGHCADGVCCDVACQGTCMACSSKLLGGKTNGTCGFVPAGTDPHAECPAEDATKCGRRGGCNGGGACAKVPDGSTCGRGTCASGVCVAGPTCVDDVTLADGTGAVFACAPFRCRSGACLGRCTSTEDCASGAQCTEDGQCTAPVVAAPPSTGCICALGAPRGNRQGDGGRALGVLAAALALLSAPLRRRARRRAPVRNAAAP